MVEAQQNETQREMNVTQIIHVAAAVIHNAEGEMLLVRKRGTRFFMQPGGKIAAGETALGALIRELREELQLDVPSYDLESLGRFSGVAANEANAQVVADVFALIGLPASVTPAAEIEELLWLGQDIPAAAAFAPLTRDEIIPRLHTRKR